MGQRESQTSIQQQYEIVKLREDGSALLQHKQTQDQFMLRTVSSNIGEEITFFQDMLRKRQQVRSSHLLDLVQIRRKQQKNVCSVVHKLYLLIEFPFKTLKDEIMDKICNTKVIPFLQAQLWSILYSCCQGLSCLYSKKMAHQSLTSNQVYINRGGIIKIADPILLGLEKNYIKVLKSSEEHVHISPQIINFLDDCNFSFYDKEKSDVFILGMILLEASLLRPIQLFDQKTKKPNLQLINSSLFEVREKYSQSFCNILEKMLQLHSKLRPRFDDLISLIEHDTSLYESTDEASFQHLTQTSHQFTNSKNCKSQKTLPRAGWIKNEEIQKNSVSLKNNGVINQIDNSNTQSIKSNNEKGEYETIIKMLKTENLMRGDVEARGTYIPPPTSQQFTYQSIQQPVHKMLHQQPIHHLGQQQFNNASQIHQFVEKIPPNFNNPHQNAHFPSPISIITAQNMNHQNSQPPSARFVEANDRFSYTKFGNITLPNLPNQQAHPQYNLQQHHQQPSHQNIQQYRSHTMNQNQLNQKPMYSYQIPEINEILNNSKAKNSAVHSNFSKTKDLPNYQQSSVPLRKQSSPKQYPLQSEGNVISLKKSNQQEKVKSLHLTKNPAVENAQLVPQTVPSYIDHSDGLEIKNKQVKNAANQYVNNGTRISLNGLLKQNSGKKNQIFAVTEKTQENMGTSPGRANVKVESSLKLNEPQRSAGDNSRDASNSKQKLDTNNWKQAQQKYVVLLLEGGGKYEGFMKNGMKNGEGKLQFNDGGYYVGEWKDNKMHGIGKLHYQNGQVAYEGDWDNDEFCGFGKVFNDRPEKFIGQFNYYDFADLGQKWIYYEGQFKNDSKHGKGKIRLTNGQVFEGNFVFDSIEGEGIFYTSKGEAVKGCWRDNILMES